MIYLISILGVIILLSIIFSVRRATLLKGIEETEKEIKELLDKTALSISDYSLENTNLDNAILDISKDQLLELLEVLEDYGKMEGVYYNGFNIRRYGYNIIVQLS